MLYEEIIKKLLLIYSLMKHLKTYHLFESIEIINAGIENAMTYQNIELFKDLVQQHNDSIDYEKIIRRIFNAPMDHYKFFDHIPSEVLKDMEIFAEIYVTIVPIKRFLMKKELPYSVKEIKLEKSNLIDGWGIETKKSFSKIYVYMFLVEKKTHTDMDKLHNTIREGGSFRHTNDSYLNSKGHRQELRRNFWEINWNIKKDELFSPFGFESDKYMPENIKKFIYTLNNNFILN